MSYELDAVLKRADLLRYGCHGIVTHEGEQDSCGKPVTVIIDGRGAEAETYWPACTYHGNRYGGGRVVPLADLLDRPLRPAHGSGS